ncbi:hypothetical protein OSH08_05470 [Kaistia geumhonensis]|uniref:Uncharacterized protein n=1 Tax=Kaistia geumhonensis TaxID=410839 RepID=A0ABU0M5U9_9HYPH|nr:hypothetical protein [Kaistia geumhonensis]MCX5478442.1 hypothetical protein [Kaistia geumhonensis]MDQ0516340.1 hypothetical protein [Kaistia geumhonensis]
MTTLQDISVWRGNSLPPIEWTWADGYAGTAQCQLTVWRRGKRLFTVDSGAGLTIDPYGRRFIWEPTVDQSRQLPLGRLCDYELEDRVGGEQTLFAGAVIGIGGLNLDDGATQPGGSLDFSYTGNTDQELDGWI